MAEPTIAEQIFESWGARYTSVATTTKEEADWIVEVDGCKYLIEEKTKFPNSEELKKRAESLEKKFHYSSVRSVSRSNRLSGILRKAKNQLLSSSSADKYQFRLVWFTSLGFDAEAKNMQFISTLYGTSRVFEVDGREMLTCYFFYNSDFYRFKDDLDGAIASYAYGNTLTMYLCLNPYSPRYEELRMSPIISKLPKGLTDPLAEEQMGNAYVADTDIDRRDSRSVLRFLERKYNTGRLANMDFHMASAEIRRPPPLS